MVRPKPLFIPFLLFLMTSCRHEAVAPYAIKDFRRQLQPLLTEIATKGIVMYQDSSSIAVISDEELKELARSENPVLRATAFVEMVQRKTFDLLDVVTDHLDDTAIVATDNGEFGIAFRRVSDHLVYRAPWERLPEKDRILDQILIKHNYLRSAYTLLIDLEPKQKYYSYIRDMAIRPRRLSLDGYELGFDEIEYALYGLSRFRKPEDVRIIKSRMMQQVWQLSDISFRIMQENPDTAYFEVLQEYHHRQFYEFSGFRPHGFSGFNADKAAPEDFINALVGQKSERSAKLLDTILMNMSRRTCLPDQRNIINEVIMAIWWHPCVAYRALREKVRADALKIYIKQNDSPVE